MSFIAENGNQSKGAGSELVKMALNPAIFKVPVPESRREMPIGFGQAGVLLGLMCEGLSPSHLAHVYETWNVSLNFLLNLSSLHDRVLPVRHFLWQAGG